MKETTMPSIALFKSQLHISTYVSIVINLKITNSANITAAINCHFMLILYHENAIIYH